MTTRTSDTEIGDLGTWTDDEMMTVAAARQLSDREVCFVGIGVPSAAANLAVRTHAPRLVMVYESGTLGTRPAFLPLSIGDGELAETAAEVVSVPEIFNYWLQPGRIDVGFLGAAQIDRFANINSTVIGAYEDPTVRLPGAGGAPEIAAGCRRVIMVLRQTPRSFVAKLDFVTSVGHGDGHGHRALLNLVGSGPSVVITQLGMSHPDPASSELVLTHLHPGTTVEAVKAATGWPLRVADELRATEPPSPAELTALRHLKRSQGRAG